MNVWGELDRLSEGRLTVAQRAARVAAQLARSYEGAVSYREKGRRDLVTLADHRAQEWIRKEISTSFPEDGFLGEEDGDVLVGEDVQAGGALRGRLWVVDPLDGTTNFVHRLPHYCVSIACLEQGEPWIGVVYDPHREEMFAAVRGGGTFLGDRRLSVSDCGELERALVAISLAAHVDPASSEIRDLLKLLARAQAVRRMGSAALNLAYLAAGRFDAYWARHGKIWDVAAGVLLVSEAGGVVTGVTGEPLDWERPHCAVAATAALHGELLEAVARS